MPTKTTVYLPDELKLALENEAARRGCSEAEVIRDAIGQVVARPSRSVGFIEGESLSGQVDALLEGFRER